MRTLAHLSDLHFGRNDPAIVEQLLVDLDRQAPDYVVISGDLVQRAKASHYRAGRQFLDRLRFPYLIIPGNHDIPVFNPFKRFFDPFRQYRRWVRPDLNPIVRDQEIALLGLASARALVFDFSQGRLDRHQIDHLQSVFAAVPADRCRILVVHHPVLPPPGAPHRRLIGGLTAARPALASAGVDLILTGHLHHAYTGRIDVGPGQALPVIAAATTTSTRLRGEANSYNLIRITPHRIDGVVRRWQGDRFEDASPFGFDRSPTGSPGIA